MAETLTITFTGVPNATTVGVSLGGGSGLAASDTITWAGGSGVPASIVSNRNYTNNTGSVATFTAVIQISTGFFNSFAINYGKQYVTSVVASNDTAATTWGLGSNGVDPSLLYLPYCFSGCTTLTTVPSYLPSKVRSLTGTFRDCSVFNYDISNWNIFKSITLESMFENAIAFQQNIRGWFTNPDVDVAFTYMFRGATAMIGVYGAGGTSPNVYFGTSPNYTPVADFFNQIPPNLTFTFSIPANTTSSIVIPLSGGTNLTGNATITVTGGTATGITTDNPSFSYTNSTGSPATITAEINLTGTGYFTRLGGSWTGAQLLTLVTTGDPTNWGMGTTDGTTPAVTSFESAFYACINLIGTPPLIPSTVTSTAYMFNDAISFNQDISNWDVTNVTKMDGMFKNATTFNQPLNTSIIDNGYEYTGWNTSSVTDMSSMFDGASSFNQDIGKWNTSAVTNMTKMFNSTTAFHQIINTTSVTVGVNTYNAWNTSAVTTMDNMFNNASSFNQSIGNWNTSNVTTMNSMFSRAVAFNQNIRSWQTKGGIVDPGTVTFTNMFNEATAMIGTYTGVSGFGTTPTSAFFNYTPESITFTFLIPASTTAIILIPLSGGTSLNSSTDTISVTGQATTAVTNNTSFTYDNSSTPSSTTITAVITVSTGYFTGLGGTWTNGAYLTGVSTTNTTTWALGLNGSNPGITSFAQAFNTCSSLVVVPTQIPTTVTDTSSMFNGATAFNQDISGWTVSSVSNMSSMFNGATAFNQDISGWTVTSVSNMSSMFNGATAFNQDISGWTVTSVSNMSSMFNGATAFNQGIGGWIVSSVTDMSSMFNGATSFNQDISGWDVSGVTTMDNMFNGATVFDQYIRTWQTNGGVVFPQVTFTDMFTGSTAMIATYGGVGGVGGATGFGTTPTATFFNASPLTLTFTFSIPASTTATILIPLSGGTNLTANSTIDVTGSSAKRITDDPSFSYTNSTGSAVTITAVVIMSGATNEYFTKFGLTSAGSSWTGGSYLTGVSTLSESTWGLGTTDGSTPGVTSFESGFVGCTNLTSVPSQIPTTVTTLRQMFYNASSFNQDINAWTTTNILNMSGMFRGATTFNQSLNSWTTASVTDMSSMFQSATAFNRSIVSWSTGNVTTMTGMFSGASVFNQNISGWDTSKVTLMTAMFQNSPLFRQYIRVWNTGAVTNYDDMFTGASAMNSTFTGVDGFGDTPTAAFFNQYPCFLEGTKIDTDKGPREVQDLRPGDKVKTFRDGYKPIVYIGTRDIAHHATPERIKNQLYICRKEKFPEATEDLVVTGCHSLLLNRLFKDDKEREEVVRVNGKVYVTDDMYRFPACMVVDQVDVYDKQGTFPIYHFALENENYHWNYGVYANGILVESSSLRYMRELSCMKLLI